MLKNRIFSKWALMGDERMSLEEYKKMILDGLSDDLKVPAITIGNAVKRFKSYKKNFYF